MCNETCYRTDATNGVCMILSDSFCLSYCVCLCVCLCGWMIGCVYDFGVLGAEKRPQ